MKVRRALTGSAALAIVLALGSCEDSPKAGTVDTPTATESSEPETTEPETTEPEPTEEPTEPVPVLEEVPGEEPEITFVKHFFDLHEYATHTGDVEPYLALATPECESCASSAAWISEKYEAGGYVEGGVYEVVDEPFVVADAGGPEVRITYSESTLTVVESAGSEPEEIPACDAVAMSVMLVPEGDGWLVDQYTAQSACE